MDGKKGSADFGIRTYFDMFKKMEDTFKFCVECKKLPDALPDSKNLRRCKRYSWSPSEVEGVSMALEACPTAPSKTHSLLQVKMLSTSL